MQAFRAVGSFRISELNFRRDVQSFSVEIAAKDAEDAEHQVLSNIGSRHRISRKNITISEITPLKNEEVTDPVVKHLIGGQ